jgi:predicted kinase
MKAYILVGLPASGKSSWAREHVAQNPNTVIVNNDTFRLEYMDREKIAKWTPQVEDYVRSQRELAIVTARHRKMDCVVDNTHMNPKTRKQIVEFCEKLGFEVELVDFQHVSVEECVQRDRLREGRARVGEKVIRDMYRKFSPRPAEGELPDWKPNGQLTKAIIVDLDGTMAQMVARGPFDEHLVHTDRARLFVMTTVRALYDNGFRVIFMSGRSERCRALTEQWIEEQCGFRFGDYFLFMRGTEDRRRDSVVKRELYEQHVQGQFDVMSVFDDRATVVRDCWKPLGLPVFRCGLIDADEF